MDIHKIYRFFMMRFRPARMQAIRTMFPKLNQQAAVLDVGGTSAWWKDMSVATKDITIVNLDTAHQTTVESAGYKFSCANGCALPFADRSFDLAFSNSVIEHVGGWEDQKKFAQELLRCGRDIYLQTPNKWFPVEPHLIAPFIHWLPFHIQRRLVRWFSVWGWVTKPSQQEIDDCIKNIRLLTASEVHTLFKGCDIKAEKFLWMTKSFLVIRRGHRP